MKRAGRDGIAGSKLLAGNEPQQDHDDGDDEQDVDESTHRVTAHKAEEPEDDQYYRDGVEHSL
jgi:hypothetical protein